jgi:hypothetical protein
MVIDRVQYSHIGFWDIGWVLPYHSGLMLAARITFAHLAAAVGVRGDDLKRLATDAGDTLVTGALHSRCQLLANACMASHKATRGLDLAEPRPSSALGGVCAVQLVAGEAARHVAARFPPPMPLLH